MIEEEKQKKEAQRLLNFFKIPLNWIGYKFTVTAVPYVIEKLELNEKLKMEELYKFIAKKHKTTDSKVNCGIRYLIENSEISGYLGKEKITNQSFILLFSILVKTNLEV